MESIDECANISSAADAASDLIPAENETKAANL